MPFHSISFVLAFLPLVVGAYAILGPASPILGKTWLICASLVFYAWSGPKAVPVLVLSIAFNYWISLRLAPDSAGSGRWLSLALAANILSLGAFKYTGFAIANADALLGTRWSAPSLLLPLGISFFTVQQIMFLVDRHQGVVPRQRFIDYVLFVSWFPYIVAGPITRWKDVIPQFQTRKMGIEGENLARGTALFVLGLAKKVVISSAFAPWADDGFLHPTGLGLMGSWLAAVSYAMELYFDFSGYTDMARGAALIFSVALPENFRDPFRSLSIIEYWQRWHISLTNFITNYIYTPILRRGRPTFRKAMMATMVTMTIAGVWHGAAWSYVLWGVWHGVGLVGNHIWRKYAKVSLHPLLSWCLTAAFVLVAFVLFRAPTVAGAGAILRSMFMPAQIGGATLREMMADSQMTRVIAMLGGIALLFYPATASQVAEQTELRPRFAFALAACTFLCIIIMQSKPTLGFIYRQF
jgi:alginate O-acetyltransferase complex protein AlgI